MGLRLRDAQPTTPSDSSADTCLPGCCGDPCGTCPNNQTCSIANGACPTNLSCDPNSGGSDNGGNTCNDCGGDGQSCCAPQNCSGKICNNGLTCDSTVGKCVTSSQNLCLDGSTPSNNCLVCICDKCADYGGGALECRSCSPGSCDANLSGKCGQIDLLNSTGGFCQVKGNTCSNSACAPSTNNPPPPPPTGNTCGNGTINSGEQCDPQANPNGCAAGQTCTSTCTCTVQTTSSDLTKTATQSCNANGSSVTVTYTITASNTSTNDLTVDIVDQLDDQITQYVNDTTISNGGVLNSGINEILWADMNIPAGNDLVLTYTAVVPKGIFGTALTNSVEMRQNSTVLNSAQATVTPLCNLPTTAIISDEADRVILGMVLLLLGILVYKFDLQNLAYLGFLNAGGKYLVAMFDEDMRNKLTDKKVKGFEKRVLK